ncbi:MAG: hypothetical protein SU899_02550 [Chloroflexota bacterium]|nr:hypothetical protein [Chloroflexota bacterium]
MVGIWDTRKHAMNALETELQSEAAIIYEAFSLLDEMLGIFSTCAETSKPAAVSGFTLLKARNLSHSMFSLSLDGLAQESGALLRPMIECLELLEYFRDDPQRVNEAWEGKLPSAGERSKRIHGEFQQLRNYLSKHASHFSLTPESVYHLIALSSGSWKWKVMQPFNEKVLRTNMSTLFAFFSFLVI